MGTKFMIETDHKLLVPILSNKCLDEFPVGIQRCHMRMMRFQLSITQVPGNALTTADAVLRALLAQITPVDEKLTMDSDIYVSAVLQNVPVTDKCIAEIQKAQEQNTAFKTVEQHISKVG